MVTRRVTGHKTSIGKTVASKLICTLSLVSLVGSLVSSTNNQWVWSQGQSIFLKSCNLHRKVKVTLHKVKINFQNGKRWGENVNLHRIHSTGLCLPVDSTMFCLKWLYIHVFANFSNIFFIHEKDSIKYSRKGLSHYESLI